MYKEQYTPLYTGEDIHLKPGQSHTLTFSGAGLAGADRLFFTGETALFYQWKDEPDYPFYYRLIDDALDAPNAWHDQYALDLSSSDGSFPRVAYHRLSWPPCLSYLGLRGHTDRWHMQISARADGLTLEENGHLTFALEIRYRQDGRDAADTTQAPDEVLSLSIPAGTYDWQVIGQDITLPCDRIASIGCVVEGEGYTGRVWLEAPTLLSENGFNILPPFAPYAGEKAQFNWLGQNLSRKEWPSFSITLNGHCLHCGELFERCHRYAENELAIAPGILLPGENTLTIQLTSHYRDALSYDLHEIGLVAHGDGFVVSVPEVVHAGEPFAILIRTEGDATFTFASDDRALRALSPLSVTGAGLHALTFCCDAPALDLSFTLSNGHTTEKCIVPRCIQHAPDGVVTGTSDMIYIHQDPRSFQDFLCWYFSQHMGNQLTIRQTYRWSGTRTRQDALWQETARLLNEAGVCYAHMIDGRELPGCHLNPTAASLAGEGFLGRQMHERDGATVYWGLLDLTGNRNTEAWFDMALRMARKDPHTIGENFLPENHIFRNGRHTEYRDMAVEEDMEAVARDTVHHLALTRRDATRHTGPSTLFKYFYQAGYTFTGAELMYGPHEIVISAMRGAAAVYGGRTGGHLAVQWSTSPHDTPARYRRYRLALFVSYIQGVDEINTEEGPWHLEEYYAHFHRFSEACRQHTAQQQALYRFLTSHSRTGHYHTPIAFLSGRYDGWRCFGRNNTWGRASFGFSEAEKAWDVLRYFYPQSVLDGLYVHQCPESPQGFYTGTPQGNVDILPIEAEELPPYRLLVAPGYNKAMEEDMDKMERYVRQGGALVLGWPQLATTTLRRAVTAYDHSYIHHPFRDAIAPDPSFAPDTFAGQPLHVSHHACAAPVCLVTDSGHPLVYDIAWGKGHVYFVNAQEYAGHPAVADAYRQLLSTLVPACLGAETCYAQGDDETQFTVYDQGNGQKHLYFLTTDWYHSEPQPHQATLLLQGQSYPVTVPFGEPVKVVACGGCALWPENSEHEVLSYDGKTAVVQGYGEARFYLAYDGAVRTITVHFTPEAPVQELCPTDL